MSNVNGLINVLKPAGMTSHDVVYKIRKLLQVKKVGHTGTLDPDVTGVLPICVGKATKVAQFLTEKEKSYQGQLTLGLVTDTQDISGQVLVEKDASHVSTLEVEKVFRSFIGVIQQIPPMVSAVRHEGKKLYELARQGQIVDREARRVEILKLEILEKSKFGEQHPEIIFDVVCSKGTYIRTLCFDIGERLGVGGCMSKLIRTQSGPFRIAEAFSLAEIEKLIGQGDLKSFLLPIDYALPDFPVVKVNPQLEDIVKHGNQIFLPGIWEKPENLNEHQLVRIYAEENFLAIGKIKHDTSYQGEGDRIILQPVTVLI